MAKQLNSEQRYVIYSDLQSKLTKKSIAQKIGVHPSTITREVKRNANRDNQYVFCVAQEKCQKRKHSTSPHGLAVNYLRTLPIHDSQLEIETKDYYSIFGSYL